MTADPFIIETIESTRICVGEKNFSAPKLQDLYRLIISPLQEVLRQPTSRHEILRKILEIRFRRQYLSPEARWEVPLDTENDLLERVFRTDPTTLAKELSLEDYAIYRDLNMEAFTQDVPGHKEVKSKLEVRWNERSQLVQECIVAGAGTDRQLSLLAQVGGDSFHGIRLLMISRSFTNSATSIH